MNSFLVLLWRRLRLLPSIGFGNTPTNRLNRGLA